MKNPRTAALTGGIASGKSTVSAMFRECGATILDADQIARQVVEPHQPAWHDIVAIFGREIIHKDERLNRTLLGEQIFRSSEKRRQLEAIIHPRVIAEIDRREAEWRLSEPERVVIVDVPLLIETGMYREYRAIIVVSVPESIQMQRLMARDGLSEAQARQRLAAQMPLKDKHAYATHLIDNAGSQANTRRQTGRIYRELLEASPSE